ncbi:MAG: chaperone NapD [Deferribacteraceae bacterium]|nr:chaperone NapD [Deferribacteraceae bacterium]
MSILASIVEFKDGCRSDVEAHLRSIDGVELYETADDSDKLIIVIDAPEDETDELCKRITAHDGVINLLHHSVHFENE